MFSKIINYNYPNDILEYVDKVEMAILNSSINDYFTKNDIPLFLYCKEIASYCYKIKQQGRDIILTEKELDDILCDVCKSEILWSFDKRSFRITHIDSNGRLVFTMTDKAKEKLIEKFNKMNA